MKVFYIILKDLQIVAQSQVHLPLYTHPQIPSMVLLMKVWVVVYNYGLVNEGVGVFGSLEDARRGFREYTGLSGRVRGGGRRSQGGLHRHLQERWSIGIRYMF